MFPTCKVGYSTLAIEQTTSHNQRITGTGAASERALEAISAGVVIVDMIDPARPIVEVNRAFTRITGYSRDEAIGRNPRFLQGRHVAPGTLARIRDAVVAGREAVETLVNERKDGSTFWNELHLSPVRDEAGVVTHYVGVQHDVTEQRWIEEELRFQGVLLDQATVAVIATEADGTVTHWNRHNEVMFGWRRGEAIGRTVQELIFPDREIPWAPGDTTTWVRGDGEPYVGELVLCRKDRSLIPVHTAVSPVPGRDGRPNGAVWIAVDVSERKAYEDRLAYQATHDALTDLPNRTLFVDRLAHAANVANRRGEILAVLVIDLDRFKLVNDALGLGAGDRVLQDVGLRLALSVRAADTLARLGGDEFGVVLENASAEIAREVGSRIIAALANPILIQGREVFIGASIGIALSSGEQTSAEALMRAADLAAFRAKRSGRGTIAMFEPGDTDPATDLLGLQADLRRAIEREQLVLHYQPVVSLADGSVVAAEALVRWRHHERGLLPPSAFLPLAEETGLITGITGWALEEACRQLATWRVILGPLAPPAVKVNLTTRDLKDPALVQRVVSALNAANLPPAALRLEITEEVLVEEIRSSSSSLQALRELGVRLAIDDFGAGASSLASIHAVDATVLKLDRSFIEGIEHLGDHRVIVGAIAAMAHALGMVVTAEGVETPAQLAAVREVGCDNVQGFLIARPLPPNELTTWLIERGLTIVRDAQHESDPDSVVASGAVDRQPALAMM